MGRFSTLLIVRASSAEVVLIEHLLHRLADRRLFRIPAAPLLQHGSRASQPYHHPEELRRTLHPPV
jgi:hypothetical protein